MGKSVEELTFYRRIGEVNMAKDRGEIDSLDAGRIYKEICRQWLMKHKTLPVGFEGFADKPSHC